MILNKHSQEPALHIGESTIEINEWIPEDSIAGIFASEPMTLPEIDHVSFFAEHAQTFFAGEG